MQEFETAKRLSEGLPGRAKFGTGSCVVWRKFTGDEYPVNDVNWAAAWSYARWVGKQLPTDKQWQKAARGPKGWTHPAGDYDPRKHKGFYNARNSGHHDEYPKLAPARSGVEGKSAYGCVHMSGDVWEWISEVGQARGGGHDTVFKYLRLDYRGGESDAGLNHRSCQHGFRCVRPK
jgi:formylglycine-generating enzyme required for sulfatase activity